MPWIHNKTARMGAIAASVLAVVSAAPAPALPLTPKVTGIRCWPPGGCQSSTRVPIGGHVLISGKGFPRSPLVSVGKGKAMRGKLLGASRILVRLNSNARSGGLRVRAVGGHWSASFGHLTPIKPVAGSVIPPATGTAFDGNGMWIWELSRTEGGNLDRIIAKAKANDVTTVFVKSGDGGGAHRTWAQFSPTLINRLHSAGLKVCAWPYVYGAKPKEEAEASINAVRLGADCLAIDAEAEYEGRYASAATYLSRLRAAIGFGFPVSLAGFPYADYHPAFPYSVFFQTGGAQFNQPQAYWRDIGKSVATVMGHTWMANGPYGKTIVPIGQLWQGPAASEIIQFRTIASGWGAPGVSWWDWQESPASLWKPLGRLLRWPQAVGPAPEWARLARGAKGDLVLWAQQHLKAAGLKVSPDGDFGPLTGAAVKAFQTANSLPSTGAIDTATWKALLRVSLPRPAWMAAQTTAMRSNRHAVDGADTNRTANSLPGLTTPKTASLRGRSEFRSIRPKH